MQRRAGPGHERRGRSLGDDPSGLSAIHGSFVPVSGGSLTDRSRSLSPKKKHGRLARQHIHVNVNVTESQMDKIANSMASHHQAGPSSRLANISTSFGGPDLDNPGSPRHREKSKNKLGDGTGAGSISPPLPPAKQNCRRVVAYQPENHDAQLESEGNNTSGTHREEHASTSTTFSELMPCVKPKVSETHNNSTACHTVMSPSPIANQDAYRYTTAASPRLACSTRAAHQSQSRGAPDWSNGNDSTVKSVLGFPDESSSVYSKSQDGNGPDGSGGTTGGQMSSKANRNNTEMPVFVHPLHLPTRKTIEAREDTATLLHSFGYLDEDPLPNGLANAPPAIPQRRNLGTIGGGNSYNSNGSGSGNARQIRRSKSAHALAALASLGRTGDASSQDRSRADRLAAIELERELQYSPLAPYFAGKNLPFKKKVMIGDNGWLERTPPTLACKVQQSPKKTGILDSIKKIAKEMTAEMKPQRRSRDADKEAKQSGAAGASARTIISLDPREQSLLYCELEYHVSSALHHYITAQLHQGRLDPDKLKKIADNWSARGRPRVVGFRYDVETQLELVMLHQDDFRFYGRRQGNPVEIHGLLTAMRTNARAIRVRTFCQPDSVVAKQVLDSQELFTLLGCPEPQQVALAEVAQFFKVIVEREQARNARFEEAARAAESRLPHGQGDRQWEPVPGSSSPHRGGGGRGGDDDPYGGLSLVPEGYDVDNEKLAYNN